MIRRLLSIIFLLSLVFAGYDFANADDVEVGLIVRGCNNNTICEAVIGEDINNCPNDCTPVVEPPEEDTDPVDSGRATGKRSLPTITSLVATPEKEAVHIAWSTNVPVLAVVSWGKTSDYELGSLAETVFVKDHSIYLAPLEINTQYYLRIEGRDSIGRTFIYNGNFSTSDEEYTNPVSNVSNLQIYQLDNNRVSISWQNPVTDQFAYVRIMRRTDRYPRDSGDGTVVYEGNKQSFIDIINPLSKVYYYAVFVRYNDMRYSSGSLGIVYIDKSQNPLDSLEGTVVSPQGPIFDPVLQGEYESSLAGLEFEQNNKKIPFIQNTVYLQQDTQTPNSLLIRAITPFENNKQILLKVYRQGAVDDYLLSFNASTSAYETSILIPEQKESIPFYLEIKGWQGLKKYQGTLEKDNQSLFDSNRGEYNTKTLIFWLLILILLLIIAIFVRHFLNRVFGVEK